MKNFDLNEFKSGKSAQTKLGNSARFVAIANNGKMLVVVKPRFGQEEVMQYNLDGRKYNGVDTEFDLVMVG